MGPRWWVWVAVWVMQSCACDGPLGSVDPASWRVDAANVVFEPTFIGATRTQHVTITNVGGATTSLSLELEPPFSASPMLLRLARGQSETVAISFSPSTAGAHEGSFAGLLSMRGEGVTPFACGDVTCAESRFDPVEGRCITTPLIDGTVCDNQCVSGTCLAGECVGQAVDCSDGDPCTTDACAETVGCVHAPVECAAPSACEVGRCDPQLGCVALPADDGVLCGDDDCVRTTVDVCVNAQCVERTRPNVNRCVNRWSPLQVPGRYSHSLAWDPVRKGLLLFGGTTATGQLLTDTWFWDGQEWEQLFPADSPPPRMMGSMVTDLERRRIVLFGGSPMDRDTWEWDGTTWLRRQSPVSPRRGAMAWDERRKRTVLFSPYWGPSSPPETWEWDGVRWTHRSTAHAPSASFQARLIWDHARQAVVMVADETLETWSYDGVDWTQLVPPRPRTLIAALLWDPQRQSVLVLGADPGSRSVTLALERDGWSDVSTMTAPQARYVAAAAWDPARQRNFVFGGIGSAVHSDLWSWDGFDWRVVDEREDLPYPIPVARAGSRVVAVGDGSDGPVSMWRFEPPRWQRVGSAIGPTDRMLPAIAWDPDRARLLVFGGGTSDPLDDTWEWDGVVWRQLHPQHRPPASFWPIARFDPSLQRSVVFGSGSSSTHTWTWDGIDWTELPLAGGPARGRSMAWNVATQRLELLGDGAHWALQHGRWLPVPHSEPSPPDDFSSMAWDPVRNLMLVVADDQTWELEGGAWRKRDPVVPISAGSQVAWEPSLQRIIALENGTAWVFLP